MNAKPNPEKPAIVVFFIIFAIMLIAALMFIFEGGWGAIYIFILASAVSIVIAFLFFSYFSVYYKWSRWGLAAVILFAAIPLLNLFHNDIIDYYSDKITLQKLWRFLPT